jgi:CelD/BcsL family acetyltransferase involved in cellulose biosynthesis
MKGAGNLLAIGVYLPDSDICIATGLFIVENRELILWSWSTRTEYRHCNPTELMTWTVMQKAMQMGCTVFPIGGGSDFKTKFGARPDLTKIRWIRSRYRWLTGARDIAEKCYRWQQAVRGNLARRRINQHFPIAHDAEPAGRQSIRP